MVMPRSDAVLSHVAGLVCPNRGPSLPDNLLERLPFISWSIVRPTWAKSLQGRLGSEFSAQVAAHHSKRPDAYSLAMDFVEVVEDAALVIPGVGQVWLAESQGEPFEVRSSSQSPNYFQFVGVYSFAVAPLPV